MQGEERRTRRRLVPQNFFHSVSSGIKTFADERLLASNLGISFFPRFRFGLAVKGNSIDILVSLASEPFFSIVTQCSSPLRCVTILTTQRLRGRLDISKPQTIKFPRRKLAREKSVTLKKSSFPR